MNNGKICIPVCASTTNEFAARVSEATHWADLIEMRLDCLDKSQFDVENSETISKSLSEIYKAANGSPLITTFRPKEQGGYRPVSQKERTRFWSGGHETTIADVEEDILKETYDWRCDKLICSHHDFTGIPLDAAGIFDRLAATGAEIVKIAIAANDTVDGIPLWQLFENARSANKGLIPVAMGEAGKWTRILGLAHGAYLTYASLLTGNETAPGQITAHDMIDVFRVKELDEQTDVYGIIAGDTTYTMSPYVHNAAFIAEKMNAVFVPFQVADLDSFITRMVRPETREVELNLRGFSVTNPHKQSILKYLDHVDEAASKIGAVNTIKVVAGKLHGFNTDAFGFENALKPNFELNGSRVAVVGAGGAARSCIYALRNAGAEVNLFARDVGKAQSLARDFDVSIEEYKGRDSHGATDFADFDIVVNTTPLGTIGETINETVATAEQLKGVSLVYDLVYNPTETRLIRESKSAGAATLGGFEMLIAQAAKQFEIWTGQTAPIDEMSAAARKKLYDN